MSDPNQEQNTNAQESTSVDNKESIELEVTDQSLDESQEEASPPFNVVSLSEAREQARQGQQEMPFAVVEGRSMTQLPLDLYIPPDALEVFLDAFEGPLDLLLYLIKKQNLDILDINVFEITEQYMKYVELMHSLNLELAAEYLVMAAMLAEIKSRILLPRNEELDAEDEEDPRAELIRRLQEYEQFKQAAEDMDGLAREGREFFTRDTFKPDVKSDIPEPDVDFKELLLAMKEVMERAEMFEEHNIERETLSTRERMTEVLDQIKGKAFVPFVSLFRPSEGKVGVVVTFLAVMELSKESLLDLVQNENFGPIHVKAKTE